ncbi:MAG: BON domain-containing protein [Thermodesulfobacteriota bacterium]
MIGLIKPLLLWTALGLTILVGSSGCAIPIAAAVGAAQAGSTAKDAYSVAQDERSVGTILADKALATTVKAKLLGAEGLKGFDVSVYCFRSHVYLVGIKEKEEDEEKALALAKSVSGVKSVSAYLLSKDEGGVGRFVDDSSITTKVKSGYIADGAMKSTQIEVETIKGNVVLLGVVSSGQDISRAVELASQVKGVKGVKSFLSVK